MGKTVHLLDTVSGNIRSLVNAIEKLGFEVQWIRNEEDLNRAEVSSRRLPLHFLVLLFFFISFPR